MREPKYIQTPQGVRYTDSSGHLGPTLQQELALMYDRVEGRLIRHGDARMVSDYFKSFVALLAGTHLGGDIVMMVIDLPLLTPARLDEVNRAIHDSRYLAENAHLLQAPSNA